MQAPAALVGVAGAAAARLDQAGVPDLADQGAVEEQAQADVALAVPQGVGDQFTDQQFGGVDQRFQVPAQQLAAGVLAGPAHTARLARQRPVPDRAGGQALDTCHQQGDVVLAVVGVECVEDVVADVLQRGGGVGERSDERLEAFVEGVIAAFDQSIRVEREQGAFG
ncbi:hypothetical protein RKD19_003048 [Streptomyces canus]